MFRAVIVIWSDGGKSGAPWWSYWSAGITNTIGPAMGIEALKYISYPAQAYSRFLKFLVFSYALMISCLFPYMYSWCSMICFIPLLNRLARHCSHL